MKRKLELNVDSADTVNPITSRAYSQRYHEILKKRVLLPVYEFRQEFMQKAADNQVVIVEGETGSGKTTQIPQFLLSLFGNTKVIACTQPRYVGDYSLSQFCYLYLSGVLQQ